MLDKQPSRRPTASDVRYTCRALAAELATSYEQFELIAPPDVAFARPSDGATNRVPELAIGRAPTQRLRTMSVDTIVVDPDALESGDTQPVVFPPISSQRLMRWTPEVAYAPPSLASRGARTITPNEVGNYVAGEIVARRR
jgi:hypothetical protein